MDHIDIPYELKTQGYSLLQGLKITDSQWTDIIHSMPDEYQAFYQSWDDLPADNFLSDGGHYRYRRYSVFNWLNSSVKDSVMNNEVETHDLDSYELELLPHEPHYQSTYRNNMNGGIYRDFGAIKPETVNNPVLKRFIQLIAPQFSFNDETSWRIQAHQFRIVANAEEAGNPSPEGIHRDGADFILIMVLHRENITGGVNHIYDDSKRLLFGSVLTEPGDAILIDDRKVWHGVSEIYPIDYSKPAYRDVLVLTFHNETMG